MIDDPSPAVTESVVMDGPVVEGADPAVPLDPAGTWSSRLHRVAGVVLFAYAVAWMFRLALLEIDRDAFDRWVELSANVGVRVAACVVWLAVLYHGLNGLRIVALDSGLAERWDLRLSAIVAFVTFALAVPGWAVLLRPFIEGRIG